MITKMQFLKNSRIFKDYNLKLNTAAVLLKGAMAVCVVPALLYPKNANADTISWQSSGDSGKWSVADNWTPAQVPGENDDVILKWDRSSQDAGPLVDTDVTVKTLTIGDDNMNGVLRFDDSGTHTLTITGTTTLLGGPAQSWFLINTSGAVAHQLGDIKVGTTVASPDSAVAVSVQSGGTLTVKDGSNVVLGAVENSIGGFGVQYANSKATVDRLVIGNAGRGIVQIRDQGVLITKSATNIGYAANGTGDVLITTSSSWNASGDIVVGLNGDGTLTVNEQGQVSLTDDSKSIIIAQSSGSTGTVIIGGENKADVAGRIDGNIRFGSGTGSILFNITDNDYTFNSKIDGHGSVTIKSGTIRFTGNNTYTDTTNVTGGALYIDGDQSSATGTVSVAGGTILGGKGTIGGNVTVAQDGILRSYNDGQSTYALTINGNLTASGATLQYDFGNSGASAKNGLMINVLGSADLSNAQVQISSESTLAAGKYHLLQYGSSITSDGLALTDDKGGQYKLKVTDANDPTDPKVVELISMNGLVLQYWDPSNNSNNKIDGGTGVWQAEGTLNNWTDENATINGPFTQDAFAIFEGTAGTVTVDNSNGAINISGLQIITTGYVIEGGTITLNAGDNHFRIGNGTADDGVTATISAQLAGAGKLIKSDHGTLILSGNNAYTGGTLIDAGILNVVNDNNLGAAAGGLTIADGTLQLAGNFTSARSISLDNSTSTIDTQNNDVTLSGVLSGTGILNKKGTGSLTLSGANTYSGGTIISQGSIHVADDGNLGASTGLLSIGDGSLIVTTNATLARAINVLTANATIDTQANQVTLSGTVSGDGALLKTGTGTLTLTGNNTHSGGTIIKQGTLVASSDQNLGGAGALLTIDNAVFQAGADLTIARPVSLAGNATVDTNAHAVTISGQIAGGGTLIKQGAGTLELTGSNSFSGGVSVQAGILQVSDDSNLGAASGNITLNNGTLKLADNLTTSRQVTLGNAGATVDASGFTGQFNGVLSGMGDLNITGNGTIILAGENNYSGETNLTSGTLYINGDQSAATGAVNVSANTVLTGFGTVGGNVNVAAGGKLLSFVADDLTRYALTINGNLTASNATLEYDFGQDPAHNTISVQVAGDIDLTGSQIDITATDPLPVGIYHLINYQGGQDWYGSDIGQHTWRRIHIAVQSA